MRLDEDLDLDTFNVHQAKTHLSRLLERVERGEELVIARAGVPVAKLVPLHPLESRRPLGRDKGKVEIAADFDEPLPWQVFPGFPT